MPQITVLSEDGMEQRTVFVQAGETVLSGLRTLGVVMENCCGNGSCKKCAIYFEHTVPEACAEDERLGKEALEAGKRLACCHKVMGDLCVRLASGMYLCEEARPKMQIEGENLKSKNATDRHRQTQESEYNVIVDIGTTTLAAAFVRESDFEIEQVLTRENSERRYGSDVVSRIRAAEEGHGVDMQAAVWTDIEAMCREFADRKGRTWQGNIRYSQMVAVGNTVMEHLLCGYPLSGLGKAPFRPFSLELVRQKKGRIFPGNGLLEETEILVLPGASAFVGADIVAGLCAVSMNRQDVVSLFLDIGTNGEMALGTGEKILATATSAGPAFEGANMTDGVPGIEGAIQQVNLLAGRPVIRTIGNKPPVGICGSGILDLASELYRSGKIDRHGTFADGITQYRVAARADGSGICFTQEDMRQLQLAKAAIRSGVDLLLKKAGVSEAEVQTVWLAGGFGCKLNVHKAVLLGLIPKGLEKKTKAVGNTALRGAYEFAKACKKYGSDPVERRFTELAQKIKVLNLAQEPEFETYYLRNMDF